MDSPSDPVSEVLRKETRGFSPVDVVDCPASWVLNTHNPSVHG